MKNLIKNSTIHENGYQRPSPGDGGTYICCKCGANFLHNGIPRDDELKRLFALIWAPRVKCPSCKSSNTKRDPRVLY